MKFGQQYDSKITNNNFRKALGGVYKSLEICHHAKVLHRDIRLPNIMLFDNNEWQLIDFGLSCFSGDRIKLNEKTEQYKQAGSIVHAASLENNYCWTINDDYEMLGELIINFLKAV
jgi:serine/threonine protein kinase